MNIGIFPVSGTIDGAEFSGTEGLAYS